MYKPCKNNNFCVFSKQTREIFYATKNASFTFFKISIAIYILNNLGFKAKRCAAYRADQIMLTAFKESTSFFYIYIHTYKLK